MSGYTYQPHTDQPTTFAPETSAPLAPIQPGSDSIDNYKPKKRIGWVIVVAVVLVAGIVGGIVLNNLPRPTASPTASQSPAVSYPTPSRTGGQAFEDATVSGYWKITNTVWGASGVQLTVEITVDTGLLHYAFYAYANDGSTQVDPVETAPTALVPGFAAPGDTIVGTLTFELTRQPMTLVMVSGSQTQLSALAVEG